MRGRLVFLACVQRWDYNPDRRYAAFFYPCNDPVSDPGSIQFKRLTTATLAKPLFIDRQSMSTAPSFFTAGPRP